MNKSDGINGWLLLIVIYLFILVVKQPIAIVNFFINDYNRLPDWIVTYSLVNVTQLALGTILIILSLIFIFKKSKMTISFILFLFSFFALTVIGLNVWYFSLVPNAISKNISDLIINLLIDVLVIGYFLKSKRVKNTFKK